MKSLKRKLHSVSTVVLLLTLSCLFTACPSDSDDSSSDSSGLAATLQRYKWMSTADYDFNEFDTWLELTKDVFVYYFVSDTEGVLRHHHKWIDSSGIDDEGHTVDNIYFEYSINGNSVNIRFIDSNFPRVTFTYDGNMLKSDSDILYSVLPSSGDWAQVRKLFPQTGTTGSCTYLFDPRTGVITISGDGPMADYSAGSQPWDGCPIKKVSFESGVTSVGNHAFYQCNTLEEVDFPRNASIKSIGVEAFAKCSALSHIDIPSSVETIKEAAFSECSNLNSIDFKKDSRGESSLKTIESYAFKGVKAYKKWNTGNYSGTRYLYSTLEIPSSVESIGTEAFSGDIEEIIIGKNMKQIAWYGIATSVSSGKMYVNRGTPPSVSSSITGRDDSWTLYVPVGCKSAYQNAAVWKNFKSIVESSSLEKGDGYTGGGSSSGGSGYKTCPDSNHPHMIDLGLPSGTKWACCNVGASKPEEYGGYYAWGEISEKSKYDWSTYKWGDYNSLTKYCKESNYGIVDNKKTLDLSDDVANVKWGVLWRMPTEDELEELINYCTSLWAKQEGINGMRFIGNNGGAIFFPAAGEKLLGHYNAEEEGYYWTSSLVEYAVSWYAERFYFTSLGIDLESGSSTGRSAGYCVRPIRN